MGLGVEDVPRTKGYDLLVNGEIRVALRVAFPGRYAHTVTVGGKRYTYNYKSWSFNFHRHGRWDRKYCDVFVCIAKRRSGADEVFVIPASAVSGPTFSLHGAGTKPYRGRYAPYRDRWTVFTESELLQVQQPLSPRRPDSHRGPQPRAVERGSAAAWRTDGYGKSRRRERGQVARCSLKHVACGPAAR